MSEASNPASIHKLGPLGAEPELSEMGRMVQESIHRYAEEVMRPIGVKLDRMTPQEAIAPESPYWPAREKFVELGFGVDTLLSLEPDHGSDMLDASRMIFHAQGNYGRPNCIATLRGDEVTISGQKSAWVSNGVIADVCILYCAADTGSGPDPRRGCVVIVPMDAKGVSRGKPLDKIGQRALNQGEVFFDNVKLTKEHLLAGPDQYLEAVYAIHTFANALMGTVFTGCGRAAFELAHAYAHERKQGGVPIIRHQSVAYRLFHMFRKVEAARSLTHRVVHYNFTSAHPSLHAAMTAKITATQTSFEVANDALQIFCGNGLTREYPIEKILRDARASLVEDGCNEILAIKGGYYLIDPDLL